MKEKATYENQHTGKMRWGRAVVCAVAGCLAFGLSADVDAEARIPIVGWGAFSQKDATAERYAEARDAGFTHLTQMCETPADAYEDLFWLEPGDAAIFAAPDSESSCELGESIKAFDKILPTP